MCVLPPYLCLRISAPRLPFMNSGANKSERLNAAIEKCINMKPQNANSNFYKELRDKVGVSSDPKQLGRPLRSGGTASTSKAADKQKIENMLSEFSGDLANLQKKFDTVAEVVLDLLGRVEDLETRIVDLEAWKSEICSNPPSSSYASAVQSTPSDSTTTERIAKLEFSASEDGRKNKLLHVQLTHPSISSDSTSTQVQDFLKQHLKMEIREVDVNMTVFKSSRPHTVIIKCSDRKYKLFIYSARKKLRSDNPQLCEQLFINDDLTSFNFSLLMRLKNEKKLRHQDGKPNFESVYTFNGKVFVKISRSDPSENSIHVKNSECIESLLSRIDSTR